MKQMDLFGTEFGTEPRKLVRPADPDTSHMAAESVDSTRLEKLVYETILGFGIVGCISDEIRGQYPHLPYSSVTARYKALIEKGLIVDTGLRRPGNSGRLQRVMCATKFWSVKVREFAVAV